MNHISISILVASLVIGGSIILSSGDHSTCNDSVRSSVAEDLRFHLPPITKGMVLESVMAPDVQERLKNLRGFEMDPKNPLWIRATKDEKMVVVAYGITLSNGSSSEVWVSFEQDEFGRWRSDETSPPIYIKQ